MRMDVGGATGRGRARRCAVNQDARASQVAGPLQPAAIGQVERGRGAFGRAIRAMQVRRMRQGLATRWGSEESLRNIDKQRRNGRGNRNGKRGLQHFGLPCDDARWVDNGAKVSMLQCKIA